MTPPGSTGRQSKQLWQSDAGLVATPVQEAEVSVVGIDSDNGNLWVATY
jgi:hypothetical protein